MLRDFVRLSYEFVRLSYEFVRQSYEFERQPSDDRYRHSKHLIDIHMYKPDDIPNSYVVRTDAVRVRTTVVIIRTAAVRSQPIASMLQEKWACRNPPCDVATDRTALRIPTTAVQSLAKSLQFQSQAIARMSYGWCKQGLRECPTAWTRASRTFRQA